MVKVIWSASYFTSYSQTPMFIGSMPMSVGTSRKFAVVSRPRIFCQTVGVGGGTLCAEMDRRIRLEVPKNCVTETTDVKLQVRDVTFTNIWENLSIYYIITYIIFSL